MPVTEEPEADVAAAVPLSADDNASEDFRAPEGETAEAGSAGSAGSMPRGAPGAQPSITDVMQMLAQLINNMPASMAAAIKA